MANKPIFFLSTHRCGTKGLAEFFKEFFPYIYSIHQPKHSRKINVFTTLRLYGRVSDRCFNYLAQQTRINKINQVESDIYIETNAFNLLLAKEIQKVFPNIKLPHIVRDPKTWVVSYMNWTKSRLKSRIAYKFIPFWNINPTQMGLISTPEWYGLEEYKKFIWWWKVKNNIIEDNYSGSSAFKTFRFEDIYNSEVDKGLKSLLNYLELEYNEKMLNFFQTKRNMSQGNIKVDEFWTKEREKALFDIAGDEIEKYQY
jgi:hypothetical protein